jgi:hypothetical protein
LPAINCRRSDPRRPSFLGNGKDDGAALSFTARRPFPDAQGVAGPVDGLDEFDRVPGVYLFAQHPDVNVHRVG